MTAGGSTKMPLEKGPGYSDHLARYGFAARYVRDKDILDFGCGDGYGSLLMQSAGANSVTGMDVDPRAIQRARFRAKNLRNVTFVCLDEVRWEPAGYENAFHVAVFLEAIEHIPRNRRLSVLAQLRRCLMPGGILVLSTPNWEVTRKFSAAIDRPLNPYHFEELTIDELRGLLDLSGFRDRLFFGLYPTNVLAYERGTHLSRTFVSRPAEFLLDGVLLKLPLFVRRQIFRGSVLAQWVGSGGHPTNAGDWEVLSLGTGPAKGGDPVHLLLTATK